MRAPRRARAAQWAPGRERGRAPRWAPCAGRTSCWRTPRARQGPGRRARAPARPRSASARASAAARAAARPPARASARAPAAASAAPRGRGVGRVGGRSHRLAYDHRRDRPRTRDVDPDPGRQGGLGLGPVRVGRGRLRGHRVLLRGCRRARARWHSRGRILAGSIRRRTRGVGGSTAPCGPGGRTVSFTTQGRFSRLAPPPVIPCAGSSAARPPYWPPPSRN